MSKIFIDTNILVYSMDNNDPIKKTKCRNILESIKNNHVGVISTQVLQEFYVTVTRKLMVSPLLAKDILYSFQNFEVVIITPEHIMEAIDCIVTNKISFWDSLIITAAGSAKCTQLWSEDLNHGQIIRGVKVHNPLLSDYIG